MEKGTITSKANTPARTHRIGGDIVAGAAVALLLIPQSLAYAEIAGVPAHIGLSAAALPALVAAYFASSPYLQTGPVALTSLLTFGALAPLAEGTTEEYVAMAALLALIVGAIRVALGLLRLGWVAYVMSPAVVLGFTSAAAVLIVCSQLPKVFGVESERQIVGGAIDALTRPPDWESAAIVISILTAATMLGGRRIHMLFPGVFLAVIAALLWSNWADYSGPVVGSLPGRFPSVSLQLPWSKATGLIFPGFVIALVGFAEPASIARTYAAQERSAWSANRELVSQGMANLTSGVLGAFPVGGSFSRTSLAHLSGAKTRLAGAVTGALVLAAMPVTSLLENLPEAVLGAVVCTAVVRLIKPNSLLATWARSRTQAIVVAVTFVATLATAPRIEYGVMCGVAASLLARRFSGPEIEDRDGPTSEIGDVFGFADDKTDPRNGQKRHYTQSDR